MTTIRTRYLLAFALALSATACQRAPAPATPATTAPVTAVPETDSHDEHAADATLATPPPAGQRWATDAPLRAGMARVRIATAALAPLARGPMDPVQVRAQADEIQAAVNAMFAECKLEPAPDAALHPLLAKLVAASQALRAAPADAAPLADLQEVLARYPQLFDDSDWPAASQ